MISPRKQQLKISRRLIGFAVGIIILIFGTVLLLIGTGNVISASWSVILTAAFSVFGVLIVTLQLFFPLRPSRAPTSIPSRKRLIYRNLEETPPFMESGTTLPRKEAVRNIYETLIQKDITTVVLTGVPGVGKTWLAALVSSYAEKQRQVGNGPFNTEVLWLKVNQDVTMIDLAGTILEAQGQYRPELDTFTPEKQAEALFDVLNTTDKARLIVLDAFELLLNEQGYVREDRSGISEWIDLINTRPCICRILITSRRGPLGTFTKRSAFREICSEGLTPPEGIELLRKQGIRATEGELHNAADNPLLLTQIASLVRERSLSLETLFDSSKKVVTQTLQEKIATNDFDVFLCYNSADRPMAEKIGQQLKEHDILPWIDAWKLQPALSRQSQLEQQIGKTKSAAVLVGKNGIDPWQRQIVEALLQEFVLRSCPVIPVLLEDISYDLRLPSLLRNMTWVDFRRKYPDPIVDLIWGITGQKKDEFASPDLQEKIATEDFDVFFCYNEQDRSEVEKIEQRLKSFGILPWLDEFRPGLPWQELLDRQIGQAKSAIVFIGENGIGPWQQQVMEALLIENVMRNCPVITVLLSNTPSSLSIPKLLGNKRVIDLRREDLEPMERLIQYITNKS